LARARAYCNSHPTSKGSNCTDCYPAYAFNVFTNRAANLRPDRTIAVRVEPVYRIILDVYLACG